MKFPRRMNKKRALKATAPKKAVKKAVNRAKVANLKRIVKSVLHKEEEVKTCYNLTVADKTDIKGAGLNYGGGSLIGYVANIIPQLTLGNTEASRIGNKVSPRSFYLRYSLQAKFTTDSGTPASVGGNTNPHMSLPFLVKVIVFRHKSAIDNATSADIIETGSGSTAITADVDTFFRPYNRDEYQIAYSKIHKLQAARHIGGGPSIYNQAQDPRFTSFALRKVKLPVPKRLTYNDTTGYAANFGWYVAVAVCNEDGSAILSTDSRVVFNAESYLNFTDS